ncbi:MAG TPA: hypothetical protein VHG51_02350 [Longimicrobiaceae bacterium]|nr:hypothetical protein [Longimicrobiaceae bacterium]
MRRSLAALLLCACATSLAGCNLSSLICGAEEERAVTVNSDPTLAYMRAPGAAPTQLTLISRVTDFELGEAAFGELFSAVERGADLGRGVVLAMTGDDPATGETVALYLALPTPLRSGTTIPVGGAFQVPLGDVGSNHLAPRTLADPSRAEVAFRSGTYHFPPPEWRTTFVATQASGTVRVTSRYGQGFALQLDLTVTDAAGRVARLQGRAGAFSERYTPPCT